MPAPNDLLEQFRDLPAERRPAEFPSVVSTPVVCGGAARLVRTRVPVWLLQQMRRLGFGDADLLASYPTLTAGDLAQAWGYAAAHPAEIDAEIAANEQY